MIFYIYICHICLYVYIYIYIYIFCNSVLRPFQNYFSSYETGQSVGGRKLENPEKIHRTHPQAELGLSHVASAGLEPTPDTAVKLLSD